MKQNKTSSVQETERRIVEMNTCKREMGLKVLPYIAAFAAILVAVVIYNPQDTSVLKVDLIYMTIGTVAWYAVRTTIVIVKKRKEKLQG